jgi:hypothetical protein
MTRSTDAPGRMLGSSSRRLPSGQRRLGCVQWHFCLTARLMTRFPGWRNASGRICSSSGPAAALSSPRCSSAASPSAWFACPVARFSLFVDDSEAKKINATKAKPVATEPVEEGRQADRTGRQPQTGATAAEDGANGCPKGYDAGPGRGFTRAVAGRETEVPEAVARPSAGPWLCWPSPETIPLQGSLLRSKSRASAAVSRPILRGRAAASLTRADSRVSATDPVPRGRRGPSHMRFRAGPSRPAEGPGEGPT